MFQQRLRPLEQLERRVVAVRLSMNEPIVATPELPAGPARAAILVYLEENVRRVVVVIRSLSRARIVQYEMRDEDYADATGLAFDAGLTFAESMGFVFDDERLAGTAGPERVAALAPLAQLIDLQVPMRPAVPFEEELQIEADPLESSDLSLELDLTKFRERNGGAAAPPPTAAEATSPPATTLGRVTPVRKLASELAPMSPMLKLLASF